MHVRPLSAALIACAVAAPAHAHFVLVEPESYAEQTILGDPQKNPPCGQFDTIDGPTDAVTTYEAGQVIEVTIRETIYHPGHYRVAIAQTPEELPDTPPVTAGRTDCESTVIDPDPVLPVLADGILIHDSPIPGNQTFEVQLPEGFTCDNCTLQVVEFMSDHALNVPGGCFYHHCATVTIVAPDAPGEDVSADVGSDVGSDASVDASADASSDAVPTDSDGHSHGDAVDTDDSVVTGGSTGGSGGSGGCAMSRAGGERPLVGVVLALVALLVGRRNLRAPR